MGDELKLSADRIRRVKTVLEHVGLYVGLALYTAVGGMVSMILINCLCSFSSLQRCSRWWKTRQRWKLGVFDMKLNSSWYSGKILPTPNWHTSQRSATYRNMTFYDDHWSPYQVRMLKIGAKMICFKKMCVLMGPLMIFEAVLLILVDLIIF